jgi:3' terminal RNA ribose 2'-O-methyltransferase Hen1
MLLTLTTTHQPATDLGFLLRKHPDRPQSFDVGFGTAHVVYPEASAERCTAALILDIDPVALVRGRRRDGGSKGGGSKGGEGGLLAQYVNDRPYAASSFLSVALGRVFGSAMTGKSEAKPELADAALPLVARLVPIACNGGAALIERLFAPLGYTVTAAPVAGDVEIRVPYWDLMLSGTQPLADLLGHLYVLIPVLDDDKHYWVSEDEVEKLLRRGEGWLAQHPERDLITRRYLKHGRRLARIALERLSELDEAAPSEADALADAAGEVVIDAPAEAAVPRLNDLRVQRVAEVLRESGARSVLDLGCGSGRLIQALLKDRQFDRIVGLDASLRDLEAAGARLKLERQSERVRDRVKLLHGALTYRDARLKGFDAATLVEVIEHIDLPMLEQLASAVFGDARPQTVVVTTPNREYNARYEALAEAALRHHDHRFEWSRAEFEAWAAAVAARHGYAVRFEGIGEADPELGTPTQMGVFTCN